MRGEFRRGHVIQTAVGMFFIVFVAPGFYHLLSVSAVQKHVHVQTFVAKSVMETFNIRVFPRAARRDVDGFGAALGKPGSRALQDLDELQARLSGDGVGPVERHVPAAGDLEGSPPRGASPCVGPESKT